MKFKLKKNKDLEIIENVFQTLDSVLGKSKDRFSFFSPQILPILPGVGKGKKHLFSPTLFSFHEKDGLFSLPNVFKSLKMNDNDEKEWLETTLMLTGASKTLEQVVRKLEPQIKDMEEKIYPAIRDLEKIDKNWRRVKRSYTKEQQMDIKKNGYAFLEPEQLELLYNNKYGRKLDLNIEEYKKLDKEGRKQRIDDDIRKLAEIDEDKMAQQISRTKRQSHGASEPPGHGNETEHHHGLITMQPWAFSTKVGEGAALEAVTLSPHAFIADIISPEALSIHTLSPRAFIAAILSPDALVSRVLSPAAFRSEVLSPRALTSFILTPEALLAEVLAPKLLEARVLSPEALIVEVLSPSLIVPRIMSDELGAVLVLSPSVLSPNILSRHVLTVEVLSPHILGGDHEHEEGEHEEGEHEEEHEEGHEEDEHSESHGHEGQHSEDHAHEEHANVAEHGQAEHGVTHETVQENVFEGHEQGETASTTAEDANGQENMAKLTIQSSFHEPPQSITNGVEHRRGVIQKIPKQPIPLREGFIEQEPPVFSENFETNQQFFQNKAEVSPKEIPTPKSVQIEREQFEQRPPPLLIHKTVQKVIQLNNKFDPDTFGENADQSERNYQIERPMVTDSWQGQSQISRFHGFGNDHRLSNHAEGHVEEIDLGPVQIGDTRIEKQSISKS
uniref:Uncharacterized protein n=1 Tax=Panagrolaimus sp. JU765 TaxID=591449 RepID=A0AC34Q6R8_9BILA